jgi:tRNA (uracil-5-)-methyltransferase
MAEAATPSARLRSMTPSSPPAKKARLDGESELVAAPTPKKQSKQPKKRKFKRPASPEPGTSEDVILRDVMALLGSEAVQAAKDAGSDYTSPLERGQEIDLVVSELSSNGMWRIRYGKFDLTALTGESISIVPSSISSTPWAVLVPFALPGETIRARVYANNRLHSMADLVSVVKTNDEMRDNSLVKCRYFGTCAGCQYQVRLSSKRRMPESNRFACIDALV